jgi:hypothetical protein
VAAPHNNIPNLEVFGKGRGDFRLPCGYVSAEGRVYNHVYLREMSGLEDDIMGDDDLHLSDRMTQIIGNCIEKLSTISKEGAGPQMITDRDEIMGAVGDDLKGGLAFTIADRMACLLYIRRLSLGDNYKVDGRICPGCNKPLHNKRIDLSKLEVGFCKDATKRNVRVKLPKSKKTATLTVLAASGERRVSEARPTAKNARSYAILGRLVSIDDYAVTGENDVEDLKVVQSLPRVDRIHLINVINIMEGSIETEIEINCNRPGCQTEFKFDLDLGQVFFSNPEEEELSVETLDWV